VLRLRAAPGAERVDLVDKDGARRVEAGLGGQKQCLDQILRLRFTTPHFKKKNILLYVEKALAYYNADVVAVN
jgi:hypothetical protein